MSTGTWRESAKNHIAKALDGVTTTDRKELRKILFDAYPWGPRENHPYKVWCEEVRHEIQRRTGEIRQASSTDAEKLARWNKSAAGWSTSAGRD